MCAFPIPSLRGGHCHHGSRSVEVEACKGLGVHCPSGRFLPELETRTEFFLRRAGFSRCASNLTHGRTHRMMGAGRNR